MPLGVYISVPFCRTKCSYCNFASDVFSRAVFERYVERVCTDMEHAAETAGRMGGRFERTIDSVYLGGGTPTILDGTQLRRLFVTISQNFQIQPGAEITVECAPGTLTPAILETLQSCGVNRVSLGAQSFVDLEAASVGRLHKRQTVFDDISRLRAAGIEEINLDLIAGLPHQTAESWEASLADAVASGVPHVSVYMLEVDEDSRLGRELIAGGARYHAHFVPDADLIADLYVAACDRLQAAGAQQYEISNFAREGCESRHNLKYWTRQPYLGFGVDAHSMLWAAGAEALGVGSPLAGLKASASTEQPAIGVSARHAGQGRTANTAEQPAIGVNARTVREERTLDAVVEGHGFSHAMIAAQDPGRSPCGVSAESVRFANPDSLEAYLTAKPPTRTPVSRQAALEETFFLGLRLNQGVDLAEVAATFGQEALATFSDTMLEFAKSGLLERRDDLIRLTPRGRLLSNEVFERFISVAGSVG